MTVIARAMSPSGDQNLLDFGVLTSGGSDPVDWSAGDWFGVAAPEAWPQDAGMPFALADDSLVGVSGASPFGGDTLGIVDGTFPSSQDFFGAVDTVNGDNPDGTASAEWRFDISGASDLSVSLDMAAMGDFEASDTYVWSYSIDGGAFTDLFVSSVDEDATQTYTMQDGDLVTYEDPMLMNGVTLDDTFRTFTGIVDGTGSEMTIRVTGASDGGSEAFAATNLVVSSGPVLTVSLADGALSEGETTALTVTRTGDLSAPLEVTLSSSDETEATLAPTVTIAAGEASATATLTAVADGIVDPDTPVTLTASAPGLAEATASATILNVDADEVAIYDIQGAGHVSDYERQTVRTEGIVTALASGGFYLQDATGDGDIATSDAIFVRSATDVEVGDALSVLGDVTEADPSGGGADLDITTLVANSVDILSSGNDLPEAVLLGEGGRLAPTETFDDDGFTSFDPETDGLDFFESLEGMRVTAQDLVAVAPTNGFGEIFAVTDQGANATGLSERGTLNISPDDFNPERIQLDTAFGTSDFDNPTVDVGDLLGDVTGVVGYSFGNYEIVPTEDFSSQVETPGDDDGRPLPPGLARLFGNDWDFPGNRPHLQRFTDKVKDKLEHVLDRAGFDIDGPDTPIAPEVTRLEGDGDTMTVASYNVLNLDPIVEDPANVLPGVSGAVDDDFGDGRFTAIAEQIVNNLKTPDIVGLQEIQDNTGAEGIDSVTDASETLELLIAEIEAAGGPTYAYFDNPFILDDAGGGIPGGNIQTAYLYNPDRVSYVEGSLRTIGGQEPGEVFEGARLPLVADFVFNGETVTVINNHFSSKGGSAPLAGLEQPFAERQEDPDVNGSVDERRAQSEAVQDFVSALLEEDPDANVVVVGDFNEFEFVSPLEGLEDAGLENLVNSLPEDERYSYIFQGNSQQLDHILVSDALADGAEFDVVHTNTEFAETPGRASDHDPVLAALDIGESEPAGPWWFDLLS